MKDVIALLEACGRMGHAAVLSGESHALTSCCFTSRSHCILYMISTKSQIFGISPEGCNRVQRLQEDLDVNTEN